MVGEEKEYDDEPLIAAVMDAAAAMEAAEATAADAPCKNAAEMEAAVGTEVAVVVVEAVVVGVLVGVDGVGLMGLIVVIMIDLVVAGVAEDEMGATGVELRGERTATTEGFDFDTDGIRVAMSFAFSALVLIHGGRELIARPGVVGRLAPISSCTFVGGDVGVGAGVGAWEDGEALLGDTDHAGASVAEPMLIERVGLMGLGFVVCTDDTMIGACSGSALVSAGAPSWTALSVGVPWSGSFPVGKLVGEVVSLAELSEALPVVCELGVNGSLSMDPSSAGSMSEDGTVATGALAGSAVAVGAVAAGAVAVGSLAMAALAVDALAMGSFAIGTLGVDALDKVLLSLSLGGTLSIGLTAGTLEMDTPCVDVRGDLGVAVVFELSEVAVALVVGTTSVLELLVLGVLGLAGDFR